jgi:hypothetical protein
MAFTDLDEHLEELAGPSVWERFATVAYDIKSNVREYMRNWQRANRGSFPTGTCAQCSREFTGRRGQRFCCGRCKCRYQQKRRGPRVRKPSAPRTKRAQQTRCAQCGAAITQRKGGPGRTKRYCSSSCVYRARLARRPS